MAETSNITLDQYSQDLLAICQWFDAVGEDMTGTLQNLARQADARQANQVGQAEWLPTQDDLSRILAVTLRAVRNISGTRNRTDTFATPRTESEGTLFNAEDAAPTYRGRTGADPTISWRIAAAANEAETVARHAHRIAVRMWLYRQMFSQNATRSSHGTNPSLEHPQRDVQEQQTTVQYVDDQMHYEQEGAPLRRFPGRRYPASSAGFRETLAAQTPRYLGWFDAHQFLWLEVLGPDFFALNLVENNFNQQWLGNATRAVGGLLAIVPQESGGGIDGVVPVFLTWNEELHTMGWPVRGDKGALTDRRLAYTTLFCDSGTRRLGRKYVEDSVKGY